MSDDDGPEIVHNQEAGRFELAQAPDDAQLSYRRAGDELALVHTEVADALEGRGVGSALVREALGYAEREDVTVVPECGFVTGWLDRHPERAAELDISAP